MQEERKQIGAGIFSVLSGALFWIVLYKILYIDREAAIGAGETGLLLSLFLVWTLATMFFFISAIHARTIFFISLIISSILFILFGLPHIGDHTRFAVSFGVAFLFLLLFLLSWNTLRFERDDRIKIRFSSMTARSLSLFFTASFLVISFAYVFSPSFSATLRDITIPRPLFNISIFPLEFMIRGVIPSLRFDSDAEELLFLLSTAESLGGGRTASLPLSPDFLRLLRRETDGDVRDLNIAEILRNPKLKSVFEEEARRRINAADPDTRVSVREEYAERFGINIEEGATLADLLYTFLNTQLRGLTRVYQHQLPFAIALGVFSTLKILSWPFKWVTVFIALLIFKFLKRIQFLKVEEQEVKKEVVRL